MGPAARWRYRRRSSACFRPGRRPRSCSTRWRPICCSAGRAPTAPEEREFLLPDVGGRPEVGRITGRGNTANLEAVLALKPDLILDIGNVNPTYVSLADRVQEQTGIPYALLDGRFDATAAAYRTLGALDRTARGRPKRSRAMPKKRSRPSPAASPTIPREQRPRVYYARGPRGLETGLGGSINVETIELLAQNVAGGTRGGLANVSIEQVLVWDPEVIVTIDQDFAARVYDDPAWAPVAAVREQARASVAQAAVRLGRFSAVGEPPDRAVVAGEDPLSGRFPEDLRALGRDFHTRFYHVTPSDAQIDRVLAGRD